MAARRDRRCTRAARGAGAGRGGCGRPRGRGGGRAAVEGLVRAGMARVHQGQEKRRPLLVRYTQGPAAWKQDRGTFPGRAAQAADEQAGQRVWKWPPGSTAARPPGLLRRFHRVLGCPRALPEERPLKRHVQPARPGLSFGTLNTQAADGCHSGLEQDQCGRRLLPKLAYTYAVWSGATEHAPTARECLTVRH